MPQTRKNHKGHGGASTNKYERMVIRLLSVLDTIKLYHWMTNNYSAHKISDELYGELQSKTDALVENIIGMKNGEGKPRIIRLSHINSIPIKVNSQAQMKKYLVDFKDYLMREITPAEGVSSMAIRDELVEAVNKYLYLDYMV
jgi:hypothetical protein